MKKLTASILGLLALSSSYAAEWNMATPYADGNFHTQNISQFAQEVAQKTDGGLNITVHSNQSLIKHPEIKNAVRDGLVQAGEVLVSRLANEHPVYGADAIPFIATSYEAAKTLYDATKPALEAELGKQGIKLLYATPWPPQGLYTKGAVATPEDLVGKKFRAYNPATEQVAVLTNMVPAQIEVSDLATAFATGRVDAMMTSPSTGVNSKVWDYLDHYYDARAWLPKNMVVVNQAAFDALSADQQSAVMAAAAEAETRGWAASADETAQKTQALADNGVVVQALSESLSETLRTVGQTIAKEWVNSWAEGQAVLDQLN
ncbi:MAG: TRAP transporter substrate-binding protein [Gammaproteobacteria bacterium]|nr:TRAP transporter substrate-binding protein [Gammaproteobacteria bacterium]